MSIFFGLIFLAQERKAQLQSQNDKLRKEIASLNAELGKVNKEKTSVNDQVKLLNTKISKREELIGNLAQERTEIEFQLGKNKRKQKAFNTELDQLKESYKKVLVNAYLKQTEASTLFFILSAENIPQMYRRYQYVKTYSDFRKNQVGEINKKKEAIEQLVLTLERDKKAKERLLAEQKKEKEKITNDKQQQQQLLVSLGKRNQDLKSQIKQKEISRQKNQAKIDKIIQEEIRKEKERRKKLAAEEAKKANIKKGAKTTTLKKEAALPMTKEAKALSSNFQLNKGKLPWPVEKGRIIQGYGKQEHREVHGVYVNNSGIDIETGEGGKARSVFKGEVRSIISLPGGNNAIIVQHGDYFTVYSNISKIYVSKGQKIETKHLLGEVYTDPMVNHTILNFQVWKNSNKQDPSTWIHR